MVEEFAWPLENWPQIWSWAESSESSEKSNEAQVARIEAATKKAKQISWIIAQDQKQNDMIAKFLIILLQTIKDDDLIHLFHNLFFRIKDNKTGQMRITSKTNNMLMIGLFVPFYQKEIEQFWLTHFFQTMYPVWQFPTMDNYWPYLQRLTFNHFNTMPVDQKTYLELIVKIKQYFKLITVEEYNDENKSDYLKTMAKWLFDQKIPPAPLPWPIPTPNDSAHHWSHWHHSQTY